MRLIDADALNEKLCKTTIFIKGGEIFQRMINDAPTIDAVNSLTYPSSLMDVKRKLIELPSAEPKTGKWVLKEHLWECDKCGCRINRANPLKGNIWNYNYCPNCGADMIGEEE